MKHDWVKHTITQGHVLDSGDGELIMFVDPDDQAASEADAAYGCDRCGVPFTPDFFHTECEGSDETNQD
jgi:hypothetical protein